MAAVLRPASSVFVITRKGNFPKGERKGYEIANFGVAGTSRKRNHLCSSTSCLSLLSFHFRAGLTAIFRCGSSMHLTSAVPSVAAAACGRFNCRAPRCSKFRLITCDLVHFEAEPCCRETLNAKGFFFFFSRVIGRIWKRPEVGRVRSFISIRRCRKAQRVRSWPTIGATLDF